MSLHGVTLLAPRIESYYLPPDPNIAERARYDTNRAKTAALFYAHHLGATIMESDGQLELHQRVLAEPNTYAFLGNSVHIAQTLAATLEQHSDRIQPAPAKLLSKCSMEEMQTFPYLLAQRGSVGGYDKFLIEDDQQLERLLRARDETDFANQDTFSAYELRTFIPTPSDRYTSFRVVTAPTGDILAGGLVYSAFTKDSANPERVSRPQDRAPSNWYRGLWGEHFSTLLSHPDSPFFLNARKAVSNISQGGSVIPLTGDNPRPTTDYERDILADHNIDPDKPRVPADIVGSSRIIGRTVGKVTALTIGQDYLQHRDTGQQHFLECGPGPGIETYRACWYGGDLMVEQVTLQRASLMASVDAMAAHHH